MAEVPPLETTCADGIDLTLLDVKSCFGDCIDPPYGRVANLGGIEKSGPIVVRTRRYDEDEIITVYEDLPPGASTGMFTLLLEPVVNPSEGWHDLEISVEGGDEDCDPSNNVALITVEGRCFPE